MLGLLTGAGRFPLLLLRQARRQGLETSVVALDRVTLPAVAHEATAARWLAVGQLEVAARHFRSRGVTEVILAGGVPRSPLAVRPRPDRHALPLLAALVGNDDRLLRRVAGIFERRGLAVVPPDDLAEPMLPPKGHLCGPPVDGFAKDLGRAWRAAKGVGARDRGQAAVARGGRLLVEDVRGTDTLLRRATPLLRRRGGVLAKVSKPGQDRRFDMPAIGPSTITAAARAGLGGIAIEAGATLVIDHEECAALGDRLGVGLWCLEHGLAGVRLAGVPPT